MHKKPTIAELTDAIGVIESYLNASDEKREETIVFLKKYYYTAGLKSGFQVVVLGDEYPEDLKARVINVIAILEGQQNN